MQFNILWVPAHPTDGAISMQRYWAALEDQRCRAKLRTVNIKAALRTAPLAAPARQARVLRAFHKYVAYPALVRRKSRRANLVHILDHSFAYLLPRVHTATPTVVTVHDLAPLQSKDVLTEAQRRRFDRNIRCLADADLLVAVSSYTARAVATFLGPRTPPIVVVPMGVEVAALKLARRPPDWWDKAIKGRRVVLSVGSNLPRKNLELLPSIFANLPEAFRAEVCLVRVGDTLASAHGRALRNILGEDGLVERSYADEDELISIYQHADALLFPSRLEGFGLPVLEAMAAGCPVLCSRSSSLPEVGGAAASYFDPDNSTEASRLLHAVLSDEEERRWMAAAGQAHAAKFDWHVHFSRLLELYDDLLRNSSSRSIKGGHP